ncbi:hypothetical protein [Mucilaginibacter psychrotolerans]|uniref:hypothetical protein n=1 Tax=Mucilaginibacter psychrotolerans TaxID=1524096 RepID=UPI0013054372|nr:hypothetical protein [Mucilaginibacter psychrotolerans]
MNLLDVFSDSAQGVGCYTQVRGDLFDRDSFYQFRFRHKFQVAFFCRQGLETNYLIDHPNRHGFPGYPAKLLPGWKLFIKLFHLGFVDIEQFGLFYGFYVKPRGFLGI